MQFFAWNETREPTPATQALKQKDYTCPECARPVRVRRGSHRQPHFFHLEAHSACSQHQKSAEHLQTQLYLMSLLPEGECSMERPFPALRRIADLSWESKKIVFEVQCSPLSLEEVKERCADYRSAGFEIVWILHQKTFNRRRMSAAESWLRKNISCYFTDISSQGKGKIYDQYDIERDALRLFKGPSLEVCLTHPLRKTTHEITTLPKQLQKRLLYWPLFFKGDLFDRWQINPHSKESVLHLLQLEKHYLSLPKEKRPLFSLFKQIYIHLLTKLLKKLSTTEDRHPASQKQKIEHHSKS